MRLCSKLQEKARKPDWLKRELPAGDNYTRIKGKLRELKLSTVRPDAGRPSTAVVTLPWLCDLPMLAA